MDQTGSGPAGLESADILLVVEEADVGRSGGIEGSHVGEYRVRVRSWPKLRTGNGSQFLEREGSRNGEKARIRHGSLLCEVFDGCLCPGYRLRGKSTLGYRDRYRWQFAIHPIQHRRCQVEGFFSENDLLL